MRLVTISKINRWSKSNNITKLVNSLVDEDDEIRKAAALSLGHIGDDSVLKYLEYAFDNDSNYFVKKDIESAINSIKNNKKYQKGESIFNEGIENHTIHAAFNIKFGA